MSTGTGRRLWTVAAVAGAAVLWHGVPALAHNQLIDSDPADEASLERAPEQVELTFLATLDPENAEVTVTGPGGAPAVAGEPEVDGARVSVPVNARLAGEYEVAYEVLSTDGHLVDGTVTFTVTEGEPPPSPTPSPTAPSPTAPTPTPAPAPSPAVASEDADGGGPAWWVWPLAGLVVAGVGYGGYRLTRRGR